MLTLALLAMTFGATGDCKPGVDCVSQSFRPGACVSTANLGTCSAAMKGKARCNSSDGNAWYYCNGTSWIPVNGSSDGGGAYVRVSGDTMTGTLNVPFLQATGDAGIAINLGVVGKITSGVSAGNGTLTVNAGDAIIQGRVFSYNGSDGGQNGFGFSGNRNFVHDGGLFLLATPAARPALLSIGTTSSATTGNLLNVYYDNFSSLAGFANNIGDWCPGDGGACWTGSKIPATCCAYSALAGLAANVNFGACRLPAAATCYRLTVTTITASAGAGNAALDVGTISGGFVSKGSLNVPCAAVAGTVTEGDCSGLIAAAATQAFRWSVESCTGDLEPIVNVCATYTVP